MNSGSVNITTHIESSLDEEIQILLLKISIISLLNIKVHIKGAIDKEIEEGTILIIVVTQVVKDFIIVDEEQTGLQTTLSAKSVANFVTLP